MRVNSNRGFRWDSEAVRDQFVSKPETLKRCGSPLPIGNLAPVKGDEGLAGIRVADWLGDLQTGVPGFRVEIAFDSSDKCPY